MLAELRQERQRQGISIDGLALALRTSSPTVSRWLRGQGLTLVALGDICERLHIDLRDLIDRAEGVREADRFTLRQERILAGDRTLSLIFFLVLNGAQPPEIQADFGISVDVIADKLDRLLRLGLVRVTRGGVYRATTTRMVRWMPGGPLAIAFDRTVKHSFLDTDFGSDDALYVSQLVRLDQKGRALVAERFKALCEEVLLQIENDRNTGTGQGDWSALFMMTRPVPREVMMAWRGQGEEPQTGKERSE